MRAFTLCLLGSALLGAVSTANGMSPTNTSFSFLQIGYGGVSFDESLYIPHPSGGTVKYDTAAGLNAAAGWQFHEYVFLFVDATLASSEGHNTRIEWWDGHFGLGGAVPVNNVVDLVGTVALASNDVEICIPACYTVEGLGTAMGLGIRAQILRGLELNARYERLMLDYEVGGQEIGSESGNIWRLGMLLGGRGHGLLLEGTRYEDAALIKAAYRHSF